MSIQFQITVGNPPYHGNINGFGFSTSTLYHIFVDRTKKLYSDILCMIIPSRWFTGGNGLQDFRHSMLSDEHMKYLVDYPNYKDVFQNTIVLAGGVCYFLCNRNYSGLCEVINVAGSTESKMLRNINEYDIFVRYNNAIHFVNRMKQKYNSFLSDRVSARRTFGLSTNYRPVSGGIPCQYIRRIGKQFAKKNRCSRYKWLFV